MFAGVSCPSPHSTPLSTPKFVKYHRYELGWAQLVHLKRHVRYFGGTLLVMAVRQRKETQVSLFPEPACQKEQGRPTCEKHGTAVRPDLWCE
jgi:hypothetical protein